MSTAQQRRNQRPGRYGGPPTGYSQEEWNRSCNRAHTKVYRVAKAIVPALLTGPDEINQWIKDYISQRIPLIKREAKKADRVAAAAAGLTLQAYLAAMGSNGRG